MRNIAKKCGYIFEPKILLVLILLIIFMVLLQNYLKLEPNVEEGFSSKRNLRRLTEKFKRINKEKFGNTKPKEPERADNLLDVIGESYGNNLMEELVMRLDITIDEFNQEMSSLFKTLKDKEVERQSYLKGRRTTLYMYMMRMVVHTYIYVCYQ